MGRRGFVCGEIIGYLPLRSVNFKFNSLLRRFGGSLQRRTPAKGPSEKHQRKSLAKSFSDCLCEPPSGGTQSAWGIRLRINCNCWLQIPRKSVERIRETAKEKRVHFRTDFGAVWMQLRMELLDRQLISIVFECRISDTLQFVSVEFPAFRLSSLLNSV